MQGGKDAQYEDRDGADRPAKVCIGGNMKQRNIKDYPIGARVKLEDDYQGEELHEVAGHMSLYGFDYLLFTDGYMAYVGRVAG